MASHYFIFIFGFSGEISAPDLVPGVQVLFCTCDPKGCKLMDAIVMCSLWFEDGIDYPVLSRNSIGRMACNAIINSQSRIVYNLRPAK